MAKVRTTRKYYKRKYKRKLRKYKIKRKKQASLMRMPGTIVSDRVITKLRYNHNFSVTTISGVPRLTVYRLNSVYDPEYATGGAQPLGFDQWATLFSRYKVYGSKLTLKFHNMNAGVGGLARICLVPTLQAAALTASDIAEAIEQPYAKNTIQGWYIPAKLSSYMSVEKILGLNKKTVEIDTGFSALVTDNPGNEAFWHIYVQSADPAVVATYWLTVTITYYVEFYDRRPLDRS